MDLSEQPWEESGKSQLFDDEFILKCIRDEDIGSAHKLLADGAPTDILLKGQVSPLHVLIGVENIVFSEDLTELLLDYGADPNIRDFDGATPVHMAAIYNRCKNLEILLAHGGDPFLKDNEGEDVIDHVSHVGCVTCQLVLYHHLFGKPYTNKNDVSTNMKTSHLSLYENSVCDNTASTLSNDSTQEICYYRLEKAFNFFPPLNTQEVYDETYTSDDISCINSVDNTDCTLPSGNKTESERNQTFESGSEVILYSSQLSNSSSGSNSFDTCSEGKTSKFHDACVIASSCLDKSPTNTTYCVKKREIRSDSPPQCLAVNDHLRSHPTRSAFEQENLSACNESLISRQSSNDTMKSNLGDFYFSKNDLDLVHDLSGFSLLSLSSSADKTTENDTRTCKQQNEACSFNESTFEEKSVDLFTDDDSVFENTLCKEYAVLTTSNTPSNIADSGRGSLVSGHCIYPIPPPQVNIAFSETSSTTSSVTSRCSCSSNAEHRLYTEDGEDFSLMECHFIPSEGCEDCHSNTSRNSGNKSVSNGDQSYESLGGCSDNPNDISLNSMKDVVAIPEEIQKLSASILRHKLGDMGDTTGPVTTSTRGIYERRLASLMQGKLANHIQPPTDTGFSRELTTILKGELDTSLYGRLDDSMCRPFLTPDKTQGWREGIQKASFNYLLLDPRITRNLPNRVKNIGDSEGFHCFLKAVLYVGKGKRARPYSHFKEAIKQLKNPHLRASDKVLHILDIWSDGLGVVSLHVFQNTIPVEAYTREACMIQVIGLKNLTNIRKGELYGPASKWSLAKRHQLGASLLYKAYKILLLEGERQITPHDISGAG